jgi:hypothetical protein
MDNLTYGLVITFVGTVGTLASLLLLVLVVNLLKRILPYRETDEEKSKEVV